MSSWRHVSPMEQLPEHLLDRITLETLKLSNPSIITLLSEYGSKVHSSAARVVFERLQVKDDELSLELSHCMANSSPLAAILQNPSRYGTFVKSVEILNPTYLQESSMLSLAHLEEDHKHSSHKYRLLPARDLEALLKYVCTIDSFTWKAVTGPPDGLCEIVSTTCSRLTSFSYSPEVRIIPKEKLGLVKWEALSLPLLSQLSLTTLHVSRLSQIGAKALAKLFSLMEESTLEEVSIDSNWLDEHLCKQLGTAGKKLKRLKIASSGTRVNDNCILSLLELCEYLEELCLDEIQGRLSKTLWEKVEIYPPNLRKIRVSISENSLHHSWSIDHLQSLSSLPLSTLSHLAITRSFGQSQITASDAGCLKRVPFSFVDAVANSTTISKLECDWWTWTPDDLKVFLERCDVIKSLRVAFDGPLSKLFTLTSTFSTALGLENFSVLIPIEHCPLLPPSPSLSARTASPNVSPTISLKALNTSYSHSGSRADESHSFKRAQQHVTEGLVPPLREVRKFARRTHRLQEISWYSNLRPEYGTWFITRPTTDPKSNLSVEVEYMPGSLRPPEVQEEELAISSYLIDVYKREGGVWTGVNADLCATERAAEKEKEAESTRLEKVARANYKKLSSIGTTGSNPGSVPRRTPRTKVSPEYNQTQLPTPISPVSSETIIILEPNPMRRKSEPTEVVVEASKLVGSSARLRAQTYSGRSSSQVESPHFRNRGESRSVVAMEGPKGGSGNRRVSYPEEKGSGSSRKVGSVRGRRPSTAKGSYRTDRSIS